MKILSGREKAEQDLKQLKKELDELNLNRPIKLAIIQVGDKMESNRYVEQKLKKAKEIGIEAKCFKFDENITQKKTSSSNGWNQWKLRWNFNSTSTS